MPKIKFNNIPVNTKRRKCSTLYSCDECPFYKKGVECEATATYPVSITYKEIIELSEDDFPTNREWLESLSDEDLAAFYTQGLLIERYSPYPINIHQMIGSFMSSQQGIKEWLSKPCLYLMEEE